MMLLAGTVPLEGVPLVCGEVGADGDFLVVGGHRIPRGQGTGAMIGSALVTADYLRLERPHAVIAGDSGQGVGSRAIYEYLIENVGRIQPQVLTLHYCLPDMALTRELCRAVGRCDRRPAMIADAASMYAAKAAGLAQDFDIFTPDATEIAFLADSEATHPAYIARHLFDTDIGHTPELVKIAYENKSAASLLLVKGSIDYVAENGTIMASVSEPDVPALEAVGGTGDTITGLVSALVYCGLELQEAAVIAAKANRTAGQLAQATPATRVSEIIDRFPEVFRTHLCTWSGVCSVTAGEYNRFMDHTNDEEGNRQ